VTDVTVDASTGRWLTAGASLWERLDALEHCDCRPACGLGAGPGELAAVIDALGGTEPARRWLTHAGFSERGITAVLATGEPETTACVARHVAALPWAGYARNALDVLESTQPRVLTPAPETTLPLFPEISAPMVREASRRVTVPDRPGFAAALARSRVTLWRDLGKMLQDLLAADFQAYRAESPPRFLGDDGEDAYLRWLLEFRDGRARAVAADYPVLFRLVGQRIAGWSAAMSELFDRLDQDWARLAETFGFDPCAALDDAVFGLSDLHHHGRQVVRLTAADRPFFYKPRSIDGEALWLDLLGELTGGPYHRALAAAPLLVRPGYGYVAEAPRTPLDRHQVEPYHRELGAVLALSYAVNGTDGHLENLVAAHGHPVIVDLETLLDAPTAVAELPGAGLFAATQGWTYLQGHSVASTGLLPHWAAWDDRVIDYSGIGAYTNGNDVHVTKRVVVENPGTLRLRLREETVTGSPAPSIPLCDGEEVAAPDHVESVVAGFTDGYRRLDRDLLLRICSARPRLVRQVLRPTMRYAATADLLLAPRRSTSGVLRTAGTLQALHQPWMSRSTLWPRVVVAEARALDRGDIPLFSVRTDELLLHHGDELIGPWFAETPLAALDSKLRTLAPADLALQSRMIRLSFAARAAGSSPHPGTGTAPAPATTSSADAADHVGTVTKRLEQEAVEVGGGIAWLTLAHDAQTERYDYRLADHGVFSGSAGTAVFLAAAGHGDLAERALTHSSEHLAAASDLTPSAHALSLLSLAYAAAWLHRCGVGVPSALADAVASIDPAVIRQDRYLDVLFGCASGLLASSRAADVFGWPRLQDCADACAETLLATQSPDTGGWHTDTSPPISGFSHGASGIMYALAEAAPSGSRVTRAVERALRFEAACFDDRTGTWRRTPDTEGHGVAWCHGAPGIGLARAGLIRAGWTDPSIRDDLTRAVEATRRHTTSTDTFCCGAVGRSELFLAAGLADEARTLLAATVLSREPGTYDLGTSTNAVCHPGLYQGWPGIAYGLLRSRDPGRHPSFALWDLPAG
jgi:type 2 lantibiotic biosynthesis protein LanM